MTSRRLRGISRTFALGGLSKLAKDLDVERIGTIHQAASDSFGTSQLFFKLKEIYKQWYGKNVNTNEIESRFRGKIYGLGKSICDDPCFEEYKHLT
jgi:CCR4-NOT transcription complex subunit 7/8